MMTRLPSQLRVKGGQRNGSGKSDSVTPPFIKIPLNQSEINHNEL